MGVHSSGNRFNFDYGQIESWSREPRTEVVAVLKPDFLTYDTGSDEQLEGLNRIAQGLDLRILLHLGDISLRNIAEATFRKELDRHLGWRLTYESGKEPKIWPYSTTQPSWLENVRQAISACKGASGASSEAREPTELSKQQFEVAKQQFDIAWNKVEKHMDRKASLSALQSEIAPALIDLERKSTEDRVAATELLKGAKILETIEEYERFVTEGSAREALGQLLSKVKLLSKDHTPVAEHIRECRQALGKLLEIEVWGRTAAKSKVGEPEARGLNQV